MKKEEILMFVRFLKLETEKYHNRFMTTEQTPLGVKLVIGDAVADEAWYVSQLKFDEDWNWLMSVARLILIDMKVPEKESVGWYAYYGLESALCMCDLDKSYRHVCDYIKWFENK